MKKYLFFCFIALFAVIISGCGKNPFAAMTGSGIPVNIGIGGVATTSLNAPPYKAYVNGSPAFVYNSKTPTSILMYVTSVGVEKADGSYVEIFSNPAGEAVDLALGGSALETALNKTGNIPAGNYKNVKVSYLNKFSIKGSITVGSTPSTTYVTKTGGYGITGSAEYYDVGLDPDKALDYKWGLNSEINEDISGAGNNDFKVYVDVEGGIIFWDGQGTKPGTGLGINPTQPGFGILAPLGIVVTKGKPGSMEVYTFPQGSVCGRLAMFFDASGKFLGGAERVKLETGLAWPEPLYTTAPVESCVKDSTGNYTIRIVTNSSWCDMKNINRGINANTNGTYTNSSGQSGSYTCTRVQ